MRKLSWTVLVVAPAVLTLSALPALASGGSLSPAPSRSAGPGSHGLSTPIVVPKGAVKAVVVKSWGVCSSDGLVWDNLNANWTRYGSQAIVIDYADPELCGDSFTLAALEASAADVVILSDPSGGGRSFTPDEIAALHTYANEGHDLIGTYLTMSSGGFYDNEALAPLFGLVEDDGWVSSPPITPRYHVRAKHGAAVRSLFRNLGKRYLSRGFDNSQRPGDLVWSENDRAGARIVAANADGSAAITLYTSSGYDAVFISTMPEYYTGGAQDKQFLYNAIIYPGRGGSTS